MSNTYKFLTYLMVFICLGNQAVFGQGVWHWKNPTITGNYIQTGQMTSEERIVLGGYKGTIVSTSDAGQTWATSYRIAEGNFLAMHFIDELKGWATTDQGEILQTEDGGVSWSHQFTEQDGSALWSIHFYDADNGYAGGHMGFIDNVILKTTDGGKTWQKATIPLRTEGFSWRGVHHVQALSPTQAVAISYDNVVYRTDDNGQNWDTTHIAVIGLGGYTEGAYFINSNTGYLVGPQAFIAKTNDGGRSWSLQMHNPDGDDYYTDYLTNISFVNEQRGWATAFGCIYGTSDGGENWTSNCGSIGSMRKDHLQFINEQTGLMVSGPNILLTEDGGLTFNDILDNGNMNTLLSAAYNGKALLVAGNFGTLFRSTDGNDWQQVDIQADDINFNDISFIDQQTGWTVGNMGRIFKTENSGETWTRISYPTESRTLRNIIALDAETFIITGTDTTVQKTTDGGSTYMTLQTGATGNVLGTFKGYGKIWLVGQNGFIATTSDNGATWSVKDSKVVVHLNDIYFATEEKGWAVGRNGNILHTEDGGETWNTQFSMVTAHLNTVAFLNELQGYVAGFGGTVLRTDDGGSTWSSIDCPSSNDLHRILPYQNGSTFFIGRFGNILQYQDDITTSMVHTQGAKVLSIYPNPARDHIVLNKLPFNKQYHLEIMDLNGRTVYKETDRTGTILTIPAAIKEGIYIIRCTQDATTYIDKLIIKQ